MPVPARSNPDPDPGLARGRSELATRTDRPRGGGLALSAARLLNFVEGVAATKAHHICFASPGRSAVDLTTGTLEIEEPRRSATGPTSGQRRRPVLPAEEHPGRRRPVRAREHARLHALGTTAPPSPGRPAAPSSPSHRSPARWEIARQAASGGGAQVRRLRRHRRAAPPRSRSTSGSRRARPNFATLHTCGARPRARSTRVSRRNSMTVASRSSRWVQQASRRSGSQPSSQWRIGRTAAPVWARSWAARC